MNNKKYSLTTKYMLSLMIMIFLVTTISAFEFDNTLNYNAETKTVTIHDCSVWLGTCLIQGDKIADLQLTSNLNEMVMRGKDVKVAEIEISNYQKDYVGAFDKIETYDLRKASTKIDRTFIYKYAKVIGTYDVPINTKVCKDKVTVNGTEKVCTSELLRTDKKDIIEWISFKELNELPEGNVKIGIFTEVKPNDYVEWIPTFFGVQIGTLKNKIWATWTDAMYVDLVSYWDFNETTGDLLDKTEQGHGNTTATGIKGYTGINEFGYGIVVITKTKINGTTAFDFSTAKNFTLSTWVYNNKTNADSKLLYKDGAYQIEISNDVIIGYCNSGGYVGTSSRALPKNTWYNLVMTVDDDSCNMYINGTYIASVSITTLEAGSDFYVDYTAQTGSNFTQDESAVWGRVLSNTEISTLWDSGTGTFWSPSDSVYPQFSNYYDNNATLVGSGTANFNVTVINTNGTVELNINGTKYMATNLTDTVYNVSLGLTNGTWSYNWSSYGNGTKQNVNYSVQRSYTINNSLPISVTATLVFPSTALTTINSSLKFNATYIATSSSLTNTTLFLWNSTNDAFATNYTILNGTSNASSLSISNIVVGSYKWNYYACAMNSSVSLCKMASANFTFTRSSYSEGTTIFNVNANESSYENFTARITTIPGAIISSTFVYNETTYSATTVCSSGECNISASIDIPLVEQQSTQNNSFYFNITVDGVISNITRYQNVSRFSFSVCNNSTAGLYLNFTFKDESSNSAMTATIDSSTWHYYLGTGAVNRTFLFSNATVNPSYAFCSNTTGLPSLKALVYDMHYTNASFYPTRTLTELFSLTSTSVTNKVLYLLSTSTGVYSTYQVVTPGNQVISGAHLIVTRVISGSTVVVADGYTDNAGTVTFFLNPNYDHTLTVTASGYASQTITLKPSSSTYTITMGGTGGYFQFSSLLEGVTYNIYPASGIISSGVHNFTFEVFSSLYALQNCSMSIRNISTTLYTVTGCINSSRGYLSQVINVTNYPQLYGNYSIKINDTWLQIEGDARWKNFANESSSDIYGSLKDALKDLYSLPEWGTDAQKSDFSRIVFFFLFFAIILAGINFYSSYDTAYPGSLFWIMTPVVLLLTIINGPGGPGFFYLSGATNLGFGGSFTSVIDNWILPVHFVLLLIIYFFTTNRRYQG